MTKSFDDVYNEAVDYSVESVVPVGVPVGVVKLAHALRVFNAIMSGGLGFATEVIEKDEFVCAVEGFKYLGLIAVANLLADLIENDETSNSKEQAQARLDEIINEGDLVLDAFRRKVAMAPSDFGV